MINTIYYILYTILSTYAILYTLYTIRYIHYTVYTIYYLIIIYSIYTHRHTFGADKERFKHSFLGRLDLVAELPGVGSYSLPSFGDYKPPPATATIPPFSASGPKIAAVEQCGVPGPAYYKIKKVNYKPATQNLDTHWV